MMANERALQLRAGQTDAERALWRRLRVLKTDGFHVRRRVLIDHVIVDFACLSAVQVHPSPARPHYLEREGLASGVYVRVGSTNRRADRELVDELRRFARGESYDEQPMPDLNSEGFTLSQAGRRRRRR